MPNFTVNLRFSSIFSQLFLFGMQVMHKIFGATVLYYSRYFSNLRTLNYQFLLHVSSFENHVSAKIENEEHFYNNLNKKKFSTHGF